MQNNIVIFKGCECTIEERRSFLDAQDFCIQKRMALLPYGEKFVNEIDNYNSNEYLWMGNHGLKKNVSAIYFQLLCLYHFRLSKCYIF